MSLLRPALAPVALLATLSACGGAAGEAVRPEDHTALSATGGTAPVCSKTPTGVRPLIVDVDPDTRAGLEASMKKGVVVVAYDCASLRVMPACKVLDGKYEYAGVSRKEQVVQLKNSDELSVNLPLSSAKLGGEVQSGRSIDLALVRVGVTSTPVARVARPELAGECEGATHYVHSSTLGAFSMATGSVGKASAVAEMFGVGGAAKSSSERKALTADGSLEACRTSNPDAPAPPAECRAPIQVELFPILPGEPVKPVKKGEADGNAPAAPLDPCPEGYALSEGRCARQENAAKLCEPDDEAGCKSQCDAGSLESCLQLGRILIGQPSVAMAPLKKACDGGVLAACGAQARMMADASETPEAARAALAMADTACEAGNGYSCYVAGDILKREALGIADPAGAMALYARGCTLGHGGACTELSKIHFEGKLIPRDAAKGLELLDKACQAGNPDQCSYLAAILEKGRAAGSTEGLTPDPERAYAGFKRACMLDATWCYRTAEAAHKIGRNEEAFGFAKRGCSVEVGASCHVLGTLHEEIDRDAAKSKAAFTQGCDFGWVESCEKIGRTPAE